MVQAGLSVLTGRIGDAPSDLWHREVLQPQFTYELEHLLPWYVAVEKVLLAEYVRMGLTDAATAAALTARLSEISAASLAPDPDANMSDIAFAIERYVLSGPVTPFPAWHADRSRNDLQATVQLLAARGWVLDVVDTLLAFGAAVTRLAGRYTDVPMPGYTHLQPAQVITPGFYLAALSEETLRAIRRLTRTYGDMDECPLGAGAMAGQELPWDRDRMAGLLGFTRPVRHALVAVASRGWAFSVNSDLAGFGATTSRFATDLMLWGTSEFGFIDLPDSLSGISSAMPQKKNFPILERIRSRSAHLAGFTVGAWAAQRSVPYTNMVESSKEASAHLLDLFQTMQSILRLFTAVMDHLSFRPERMLAACQREYLGGFTLANLLTLRAGIPWRTAQIIAGRYVVSAAERELSPASPDAALLTRLAAGDGYQLTDPGPMILEAFSVDGALEAKQSAGSARPAAVRQLLAGQDQELAELAAWSRARREISARACAGVDVTPGR